MSENGQDSLGTWALHNQRFIFFPEIWGIRISRDLANHAWYRETGLGLKLVLVFVICRDGLRLQLEMRGWRLRLGMFPRREGRMIVKDITYLISARI